MKAARPERSVPMPKTKYVLLLPLTYNDGTRVPKEVRDQIEEELFVRFGGFSLRRVRQGSLPDDGWAEIS
jgi:hypothetical protein